MSVYTMPKNKKLQHILDQQKALAEFGRFAFRSNNLQNVLDKAALICATCLEVQYCKICRFRQDQGDLLIVAGCGWQPGIVGVAVSKADASSPGGRAFTTKKPVMCPDLRFANDYVLPSFYGQHGILSTVNVVIQGSNGDAPYGILEIDSPDPRDYDVDDTNFLTTFANVLAEAVATTHRMEQLQAALDEKEVLARELQHRVRNNLHLISGMLTLEANSAPDIEDGFRTIASRVQTLATVYDHLLGTGMARDLEFRDYLKTLCGNLQSFQQGNVALVATRLASLRVDLDTGTAIGLAVTELITNSYKHAFPTGEGTIEVSIIHRGDTAVISVEDDGVGLVATKTSNRHGLGLVQRLVQQAEGEIRVRQKTRGTCYEIELPL